MLYIEIINCVSYDLLLLFCFENYDWILSIIYYYYSIIYSLLIYTYPYIHYNWIIIKKCSVRCVKKYINTDIDL